MKNPTEVENPLGLRPLPLVQGRELLARHSTLATSHSGLSGDARHTELYQKTIKMRCTCCGNFLCQRDRMEGVTDLCLDCQLTCSVQVMELEHHTHWCVEVPQ